MFDVQSYPITLSHTHSWYGDYTMDVLLSSTLGASQDSIGEHGALIAAVGNALTAQQQGRILNHMTMRVVLCKFSICMQISCMVVCRGIARVSQRGV